MSLPLRLWSGAVAQSTAKYRGRADRGRAAGGVLSAAGFAWQCREFSSGDPASSEMRSPLGCEPGESDQSGLPILRSCTTINPDCQVKNSKISLKDGCSGPPYPSAILK